MDHNVESQEQPYTQLGKGACQSFTLSQADSAGLVEGITRSMGGMDWKWSLRSLGQWNLWTSGPGKGHMESERTED